MLKKLILMITISSPLSSCALWPYQKDFDCPIQEGLKCKSLHEVSEMADKGMFGANVIKPDADKDSKSKRLGRRKRGICHAR